MLKSSYSIENSGVLSATAQSPVTVWPPLVPNVSPALVCVLHRDTEGYFLCEPTQTTW